MIEQQLAVLALTSEVMCGPDDSTKVSSYCITQTQQRLKQMQHDLSQLESMAEKAAVAVRIQSN